MGAGFILEACLSSAHQNTRRMRKKNGLKKTKKLYFQRLYGLTSIHMFHMNIYVDKQIIAAIYNIAELTNECIIYKCRQLSQWIIVGVFNEAVKYVYSKVRTRAYLIHRSNFSYFWFREDNGHGRWKMIVNYNLFKFTQPVI